MTSLLIALMSRKLQTVYIIYTCVE